MAKRKRSRSKSHFAMSGITGTIVGVGGYIVYEAYLSPMIPLNATTKNVAELILGMYLAKRSGVLGNVGKAAVILNSYLLLKAFVPLGSNSSSFA